MSRTKRLEESDEPMLLIASERCEIPASSAIALLTTMRSAAGPGVEAEGRFTCVGRQLMHLRADERSVRSSRRAKDISDSTFESGRTARLFEEPAYAGLRCMLSSGANP